MLHLVFLVSLYSLTITGLLSPEAFQLIINLRVTLEMKLVMEFVLAYMTSFVVWLMHK